jgi:hypothetical protein
MLLNEFFKKHREAQQQQQEIDFLKAELREQRDLIQKVTEQIEFRETACRVARIDQ